MSGELLSPFILKALSAICIIVLGILAYFTRSWHNLLVKRVDSLEQSLDSMKSEAVRKPELEAVRDEIRRVEARLKEDIKHSVETLGKHLGEKLDLILTVVNK